KLNGKNFRTWYLFIQNFLKGKRLFQYTEVDIIAERTNVFNQLINDLQNLQAQAENNQNNRELQANIQNIQEQLIQQQNAIEEAIANDAMANSIIIANVTDKVLKFIERREKVFEKMEKIKQFYERDEEEEHYIWYKRLYELKASDINNTMDVINEIMELFNTLHDTNLNPNNLEKLTILHNALPNEIKNIVNFSADVNPIEFYNDIKNKIFIRKYNSKSNRLTSLNNNYIQNSQEDNMDLDYDLNHVYHHTKNLRNSKSYPSNKKFCHICKINGHSTDECFFNAKTNKRIRNSKNYKNKSIN
ncbi:hypothetical protein U3516DRAFT_482110, partial [Neocallimastix sp. 'constans']